MKSRLTHAAAQEHGTPDGRTRGRARSARSTARSAACALIALLTAACLPAPAADLALWRSLDWFHGSWRGEEKSAIGEGYGTRCATRLFDGRFQFTRSRTEISPEGDRAGGVWERWQIMSRDPDTGRITLDQYDSSGYRQVFELDAAASRPDRFLFRASDLGTAAAGEGRLTLQVRRGERFEERLELGMGGEPLRTVSTHRWSRISNDPGDCVHTPPELPGWFSRAE
jgi:hypothetical protein